MIERDYGRFYVTNVVGTYERSIVILAEIYFWARHERELDRWCQEHGAVRQGMTVDMDEETLMLFILRWA